MEVNKGRWNFTFGWEHQYNELVSNQRESQSEKDKIADKKKIVSQTSVYVRTVDEHLKKEIYQKVLNKE